MYFLKVKAHHRDLFAVHIHPSIHPTAWFTARSRSIRVRAGSACCLVLQGSRGVGVVGGCLLRLEYAVLNILKVYQITPKSEVACPKKDSITASNWGRFLPTLQIKLSLKLFVLGGLCPTHQAPRQNPTLINKNTNLHFQMHKEGR